MLECHGLFVFVFLILINFRSLPQELRNFDLLKATKGCNLAEAPTRNHSVQSPPGDCASSPHWIKVFKNSLVTPLYDLSVDYCDLKKTTQTKKQMNVLKLVN